MKRPILSIVVPTKNRYMYLYHLINLLSSFNNEDFELVIQDNSDDNTEFLNKVNISNYEFIKYYYQKGPVSQSGNSDLSILNSTGEYVCFIGDDDGVLYSIFDIVRYMSAKGIDALISKNIIYNWPDYVDNSIYKKTATVLFNKGTATYKDINPKEEFLKSQKVCFKNMALMPRVYQAIVRRKYLDDVYDQCGSYFPGPSPDMANAVALSILSKPPRTVYYDAPIIITGQSKNVGGGERLIKKDMLKRIEDVSFLPKNVKDIWDRNLPEYWCSDTVWPASAIEAFSKITSSHLHYDKDLLIARFLYDHPAYCKECIGLARSKMRVFVFCFRFLLGRTILQLREALSYYLSRKTRITNLTLIRNVNNISEAVRMLKEVNIF